MLKPLTLLSPEMALLLYCLGMAATIIVVSLVVTAICNISVEGKPATRNKKKPKAPGYSVAAKENIREVS